MQCASLCGDALAWAYGDIKFDRAQWICDSCLWLHCFDEGRLVGYLALQPYEDDLYLMHYGGLPGYRLTSAIFRGFRVARGIAEHNGKTLAAYINDETAVTLRLAKAFGFKPLRKDFYYYGQ